MRCAIAPSPRHTTAQAMVIARRNIRTSLWRRRPHHEAWSVPGTSPGRPALFDGDRDLADAGLPLAGRRVVHRVSACVDRNRDWHVLDVELVDGLHAELGKCDD